MPNLQRHPEKLCLIKYELHAYIFIFIFVSTRKELKNYKNVTFPIFLSNQSLKGTIVSRALSSLHLGVLKNKIKILPLINFFVGPMTLMHEFRNIWRQPGWFALYLPRPSCIRNQATRNNMIVNMRP